MFQVVCFILSFVGDYVERARVSLAPLYRYMYLILSFEIICMITSSLSDSFCSFLLFFRSFCSVSFRFVSCLHVASTSSPSSSYGPLDASDRHKAAARRPSTPPLLTCRCAVPCHLRSGTLRGWTTYRVLGDTPAGDKNHIQYAYTTRSDLAWRWGQDISLPLAF